MFPVRRHAFDGNCSHFAVEFDFGPAARHTSPDRAAASTRIVQFPAHQRLAEAVPASLPVGARIIPSLEGVSTPERLVSRR